MSKRERPVAHSPRRASPSSPEEVPVSWRPRIAAARRAAASRSASTSRCRLEQGLNSWCDLSLTFDHFHVRKVMFVKAAEGFVIFPGGFGTQDELWEALTLRQTKKIGDFPIVLFDSDYWGEMLGWVRDEMLDDGLISREDYAGMLRADVPADAVELVVSLYDRRVAEGST